MTFLEGVDISSHNPASKIDYKALARSKAYVWARTGDGITTLDKSVGEHLQGCHGEGMLVGVYHFWRASRDPEEQAALLLSQRHYQRAELPPAIDMEVGSDMGLPVDVVRERLCKTARMVEREAGRCLIYTAASWCNQFFGDRADLLPFELWCAHYTTADTPWLPKAWVGRGWRFWQYSGSGSAPGVPGLCDLNRFAGTAEELADWAEGVCR